MKRFPPGNDKGSPVGEFEPDFFSVVRTLTEMSYFDRRVLARRGGAAVTQDRFLYKYRAVDVSNKPSVLQLRDLIVLSKFWLSSVSDFNDPFDGSGNMIAEGTAGDKRTRIGKFFDLQGLSWSKKQKAIAKLATKPNSYFEAKVREYYRSYYARVGISCFAGDPRNVLMWSHYANKHTGIWLQFESARDPETFAHTVGMTYSMDYPTVNWLKAKDFYEGFAIVMRQKAEGWRYEKETRIRKMEGAKTYIGFKPEALRAICFGCRSDASTKNAVMDLVKERTNRGLPSIRLYQAHQHETKYCLRIFRFVPG